MQVRSHSSSALCHLTIRRAHLTTIDLSPESRAETPRTASSDRREPIGEVRSSTAPGLDPLALLASEDAKAVMLHFMQPARSCGRLICERGLARADETGRRVAAPQGRWRAPDCGDQVEPFFRVSHALFAASCRLRSCISFGPYFTTPLAMHHVLIRAAAAQSVHAKKHDPNIATCVALAGLHAIERGNGRAVGNGASGPERQRLIAHLYFCRRRISITWSKVMSTTTGLRFLACRRRARPIAPYIEWRRRSMYSGSVVSTSFG